MTGFYWKFGQGEKFRRINSWSDERKRTHSERMEQAWVQRKPNLSRQWFYVYFVQSPIGEIFIIIIINILFLNTDLELVKSSKVWE